MSAWWTHRTSAADTRILIVLETSPTAWMATSDIVDHFLLVPCGTEDYIRRRLGELRSRGILERRPIDANSEHQWRISGNKLLARGRIAE